MQTVPFLPICINLCGNFISLGVRNCLFKLLLIAHRAHSNTLHPGTYIAGISFPISSCLFRKKKKKEKKRMINELSYLKPWKNIKQDWPKNNPVGKNLK